MDEQYALVVADRQVNAYHAFFPDFPSRRWLENDTNKIHTLGQNSVYAFAGTDVLDKTKAQTTYEHTGVDLRGGVHVQTNTFSGVFQATIDFFKKAASLTECYPRIFKVVPGEPAVPLIYDEDIIFSVLVAAYYGKPRFDTFEISFDGRISYPNSTIASAPQPLPSVEAYLRKSFPIPSNPMPLHSALHLLRMAIAFTQKEERGLISLDTDVVLIGKEGIKAFDAYQEFPESSDPKYTRGTMRYFFPITARKFLDKLGKEVAAAKDSKEANLQYHVAFSGLQEIVSFLLDRELLRDIAFSGVNFEEDQFYYEITSGNMPKTALAPQDLEARIKWVSDRLRPVSLEMEILGGPTAELTNLAGRDLHHLVQWIPV